MVSNVLLRSERRGAPARRMAFSRRTPHARPGPKKRGAAGGRAIRRRRRQTAGRRTTPGSRAGARTRPRPQFNPGASPAGRGDLSRARALSSRGGRARWPRSAPSPPFFYFRLDPLAAFSRCSCVSAPPRCARPSPLFFALELEPRAPTHPPHPPISSTDNNNRNQNNTRRPHSPPPALLAPSGPPPAAVPWKRDPTCAKGRPRGVRVCVTNQSETCVAAPVASHRIAHSDNTRQSFDQANAR